MKLKDLLIDYCSIKKSDFNNLKNLNFSGVYILCCGDDVVYVGSAYARTIETRLKQYLSTTDTGNSLMRAIYKMDNKDNSFSNASDDDKKAIVDKIKKFKIYAIKHEDLEYKLIEKANPKYNHKGNNEP